MNFFTTTVPRHSTFQQFVCNFSRKDAARAEIWAQSIVDKLPAQYRFMPMALDIAVLKGGGFTLIESNPQGNSGFLIILRKSSRALDRLLKQVPSMQKKKLINWGLTGQEQIQFLESIFKEKNIDKQKVLELVKMREQARLDKDWSKADEARDSLHAMGIDFQDTDDGVKWNVKV